MPIELYWALPSQPSRALKAYLEDAGIPYTDRHLDISKGEQRTPEILKLNPKGTVPFIVSDGKTMIETVAIMRYLAKMHPTQLDRLYPKGDLKKRYTIDKWCDWYTQDLRPVFTRKALGLFLRARSEQRGLNEFDKMTLKTGLK